MHYLSILRAEMYSWLKTTLKSCATIVCYSMSAEQVGVGKQIGVGEIAGLQAPSGLQLCQKWDQNTFFKISLEKLQFTNKEILSTFIHSC